MRIDLYQGESLLCTLAQETANDGVEDWTIPLDFPEASSYRIRITSLNGELAVSDAGDGTFRTMKQAVWDAYTRKDTYVADSTPNRNYGSWDKLELGTDSKLGLITNHSRTLIGFDVADNVPASVTVRRATLQVFLTEVSGAVPFQALIGWVVGPWSEGNVNWKSQPEARAVEGMIYSVPRGTGYVEFDVTRQVQEMVRLGSDEGFLLTAVSEGGREALVLFASREQGTPARLTVVYVP